MKTETFLALLLLTIVGYGCSKKETPPQEDCGCNSPTVWTIKEYLEEEISYANNQNTYYPNTFWIGKGFHFFIVCNEDILPQKIRDLKYKEEGTTIKVKIQGEVKTLCKKWIHPVNYSYNHITLTKIEVL